MSVTLLLFSNLANVTTGALSWRGYSSATLLILAFSTGDQKDFVMVSQKTATEVGQELEVQQGMEEGCLRG